jgi:two-component system, response regulator YesN
MYKVLIVDDEPHILKGLKSIVNWEEYGMEIVAEAIDGAEALDIIRKSKIHIVLTDIRMQRMTGIELLENLRRENSEVKAIILSGYDDFQYVREAVKLGVENYLLKPVNRDELSSTLLNLVDKIESELYNKIRQKDIMNSFRENILNRWMSNTISKRELIERADLLNIDLKFKQYFVAIVKKINDSNIVDKMLESFAILNICSEVISNSCENIVFNDLNANTVIVFYCDDFNLRMEKVKERLKASMNAIREYLNMEVFITTGTIENGFEFAHQSYFNAMQLQQHNLIYSPYSIVDFYETKRKMNIIASNMYFDQDMLKKLIISKNREQCLAFFEEIIRNRLLAQEEIQDIAIEAVYCIMDTVRNYASRKNEATKKISTKLSEVYGICSEKQLLEWLMSKADKAIDFLISGEEAASPLIKQIMNYIELHYSKEVSLKTLSSLHNVNASYLGQMFKNETGELFTNYLNRIRIDKAKELLSNTSLKIYRISEQVGYIDQSHFFRIFKKYSGISPEEYRNHTESMNK